MFSLCENTTITQLADCFTTIIGAYDVSCPACSTPVRAMTIGYAGAEQVDESAQSGISAAKERAMTADTHAGEAMKSAG